MKHFYPLLFQKMATFGGFFTLLKAALGLAWCRKWHSGIINRSKTAYECAKCHRIHLYSWYPYTIIHVPVGPDRTPRCPDCRVELAAGMCPRGHRQPAK